MSETKREMERGERRDGKRREERWKERERERETKNQNHQEPIPGGFDVVIGQTPKQPNLK